jgi:hypothetical protein
MNEEGAMKNAFPLALICAAALPACELIPDLAPVTLVSGADDETWFLMTDRDVYEAEIGHMVVGQDTIWYLQFTIEITYTNHSDAPVYLWALPRPSLEDPLQAGAPVAPEVERLTDDENWEVVYREGVQASLAGLKLAPGESLVYQRRFRAYDPQANVSPAWRANTVEGVYRLNFREVRTGPNGSELAPLQARVSNPFRLTGSLPKP